MLGRILPNVRARLVALLLVGAVPLFALASSIAVQNYWVVADSTRQKIVAAREGIRARLGGFIPDAGRLLTALSNVSALGNDDLNGCAVVLARMNALGDGRYVGFDVLDAAGRERCGGPGHAADTTSLVSIDAATLRQVQGSLHPKSGAAAADLVVRPAVGSSVWAAGRPEFVVPVILAFPTASFSGAVRAWLRLAWLTDSANDQTGIASWVLSDTDTATPLGTERAGMLPNADTLRRVRAAPDRVRAGFSQEGEPFVYALVSVLNDTTLLLAEPATADLARAESALGRRLSELGLLLLVGLIGVAVGADAVIVRPQRALAAAVTRWRAGGPFEPGALRGAPSELRELARSFVASIAILEQRGQQLHAAAAQQDLLMQEIHHRVKNNLQIIASLLNLQASRIRLPEARAEFQSARDRIRALATLHRHLYAHGELHTINMRAFLYELCEQLLVAFGEKPPGGRIGLTIDAPELQISSDQAVPIALIVTEAVSNAAKYAFPAGRSGTIAVHLEVEDTAQGGQRARLCIDDDGIGIPAGRTDTETGVRDGIGLTLIRGFARQLGATLHITEDGGTHYVVEIPLRKDRVDPEELLEAG